jgi:glutathione S-transferase
MKHYFHPMSRGVTTDWMLTELEAPHEKIIIDFFAGENNTPEYRAINPMGKVPALEDDGRIVTETAAICAYLADKYLDKGFAPAVSSPDRARYYRYLFFPGTTLEPMFSVDQLGITDFNPQSVGWGDRDRCMVTVESMTPEIRLGNGRAIYRRRCRIWWHFGFCHAVRMVEGRLTQSCGVREAYSGQTRVPTDTSSSGESVNDLLSKPLGTLSSSVTELRVIRKTPT